MTRTKKIYGFRLNEGIPKWKDRLGKGNGKIIKLIWLDYIKKFQIVISNGNSQTAEWLLQDEFFERGLANEY